MKKIPQSSAWCTVAIVTASLATTTAPPPLSPEALIVYLKRLLLHFSVKDLTFFNGVTPAFR